MVLDWTGMSNTKNEKSRKKAIIQPYGIVPSTEEPDLGSTRLTAQDLFSMFAAEIVKKKKRFAR